MNELERELTKLLDEKFRGVRVPTTAPQQVLRRTRRRQLGTATAGTAAAVLVLAGSILGVRAIVGANEQIPADRSVETADGVTITIPRGWSLVPCEDLTPEQRCLTSTGVCCGLDRGRRERGCRPASPSESNRLTSSCTHRRETR